ncbi:MAG: hypothetical protein NVSMB67_29950 [Flavisolibacter sp.]
MNYNELFFRLVIVIIIGGLIGVERELKSKSAGFRTIMLICVGSFLFTIFSKYISPQSPDRIASNIVTGIGFLGAGVIFKGDNKVNGLTTAATIWVTAALGMGVATGLYEFVVIATGIVLASLFFLVKLEALIDRINQFRTYKIFFPLQGEGADNFDKTIQDFSLKGKRIYQAKEEKVMIVSWIIQGSEKNHPKLVHFLYSEDHIIKFEV